jgi:hypothetical protein
MDPAIQSIGVAEALIERLAAIVRAQKAGVTLLSAEEADELSLRIGEAQQIAPEVWRHLDAARATLPDEAPGAAAYDEVRALQDGANLATTSIDASQHLDYLGIVAGPLGTISFKSVTWDSRMILRAVVACAALKSARPDVDWARIERTDRETIAAAGSLQTARWKALAKVVAVLGVVLALVTGVRRLVMSDPPVEAPPPEVVKRARARQLEQERAAILAKDYAARPCDKATVGAYVTYLEAIGERHAATGVMYRHVTDCPETK